MSIGTRIPASFFILHHLHSGIVTLRHWLIMDTGVMMVKGYYGPMGYQAQTVIQVITVMVLQVETSSVR